MLHVTSNISRKKEDLWRAEENKLYHAACEYIGVQTYGELKKTNYITQACEDIVVQSYAELKINVENTKW